MEKFIRVFYNDGTGKVQAVYGTLIEFNKDYLKVVRARDGEVILIFREKIVRVEGDVN